MPAQPKNLDSKQNLDHNSGPSHSLGSTMRHLVCSLLLVCSFLFAEEEASSNSLVDYLKSPIPRVAGSVNVITGDWIDQVSHYEATGPDSLLTQSQNNWRTASPFGTRISIGLSLHTSLRYGCLMGDYLILRLMKISNLSWCLKKALPTL